MYFAPFREEFEELGFKETRCVFVGESLDFPQVFSLIDSSIADFIM